MYAEEAQQQEKVLQGLKEKEADGADIRNAVRPSTSYLPAVDC
jgi:hypothetical protein